MSVVFANLVDALTPIAYNSITADELEQFERAWIIYILKEYRYGQAFCEHFRIGNATPLYHFKDEAISRRWVIDNYLEK